MTQLQIFDRFEERVAETAHLFVLGAKLLNAMTAGHKPSDVVRFSHWAGKLLEEPGVNEELATPTRLMWLWEALRTEPDFRTRFGKLPAATAPWKNKQERFEVFRPGEWFVIGMKPAQVEMLLRNRRAPQEESVFVHTKAALQMKPGKGGRLECCDCASVLTIPVAEILDVSREADIMRIDVNHVTCGDGVVTVQVDSLNQAYTVASRRLEPERRGHGGRTYDHVVHVRGSNRTLLEDIRLSVESGQWKVPDSPATPRGEESATINEQGNMHGGGQVH